MREMEGGADKGFKVSLGIFCFSVITVDYKSQSFLGALDLPGI